jgi:hypothetical protein
MDSMEISCPKLWYHHCLVQWNTNCKLAVYPSLLCIGWSIEVKGDYLNKCSVCGISKGIDFIRLHKQNVKCEEIYTAISFSSLTAHIPYLAAHEVVPSRLISRLACSAEFSLTGCWYVF